MAERARKNDWPYDPESFKPADVDFWDPKKRRKMSFS